MSELRFRFDVHGLGDVVHFAHAVQLWRQRGVDVTVQVEENKKFVWQVAGVNTVQGGGLPFHDYGYPAGFDDLSLPDHDTNKVAHGLRHNVMAPTLEGDNRRQWDELCEVRLDARPHVSEQATDEASRFLTGLPRPIICLHSRGTNWHERKSLSDETAADVQRDFLRSSAGSMVILDWDSRAPQIGHERIRGIIPTWGRINPEHLTALLMQCDAMIGVDSGPLHLAAMTSIPCVGVFHSLHPNRCCLPNPNCVYMVSARHDSHWQSLADRWRLYQYATDLPTGAEIVSVATQLADGRIQVESMTPPSAIAGLYLYERVGHDERVIELKPDGSVGRGAGAAERRWFWMRDQLHLSGEHGVIASLSPSETGLFRGEWTQFEQMPVVMTPISMPLEDRT